MIIRFDENFNIEATEEESIIAGNDNVNEIKIFMYDGFDFLENKAYLNFELSDGKQFNNRPTTKEYKLNETGLDEEQCFYYIMPKYLLKQPGRLRLTMRISPLFEMSNIDNSSLITTQVYYAVFPNGEEIIDPKTEEMLRQDIANVQISTQTSARQYVEELAASGAFKGDTGPQGPAGPQGPEGPQGEPGKSAFSNTSELINDGDGTSPYTTVNDVKSEISNLINSAPETLDTLGEIANALAENEDVIEAINQAIGTKANKSDLINMLNYKGETTEDNVGNLLNAVGDMCYVTGTREYRLCVESTFENGHINKKFMPILGGIDSSKFASYETFNDLLNNRINISNDSSGGAIGYGASAGKGFAGGQNAKTTQLMESGATRVVDAIQLGTGTNLQDRTLQVYGDNIYDATTHTAKFQNITLDGEDLQEILSNIKPEITVDTSVSSTSTNPVQNKAIYSYVQSIKNSIDYDNLQDKPITNYSSSILDLSSSAIGIYAITAESCELRYAYGLIATLTKGDVVLTNQIHAVALELNTNRTYNSVIYLINTNSDTVHKTYLDSDLLTRNDIADLATKQYVDTAVANLVDSAPDTLNTLGEIATALKENEDVVEALNEAITNKANTSDLENYLPLTAGSSKKLTGSLYLTKETVVSNHIQIKGLDTSGSAKGLIGLSNTNNVWINYDNSGKTIIGGTAVQPFTANHHVTDLGIETAAFRNIRGKAIYQNGKQVANKEDIPTIVTLTQAEYDALGTYDETTLYLIKEE